MIYDQQVLGPPDGPLGLNCAGRRRVGLELGLRAREPDIEMRYIDDLDLKAGLARAGGIGFAQGMAEAVAARIGMSLDNGDALGHQEPAFQDEDESRTPVDMAAALG